MTKLEEFKLPPCDNCQRPALGLVEGQPRNLCMKCFEDHVEDGKWAIMELGRLAPTLDDEQRWAIWVLFTEKMCYHCKGPAPCHCWNDE